MYEKIESLDQVQRGIVMHAADCQQAANNVLRKDGEWILREHGTGKHADSADAARGESAADGRVVPGQL